MPVVDPLLPFETRRFSGSYAARAGAYYRQGLEGWYSNSKTELRNNADIGIMGS